MTFATIPFATACCISGLALGRTQIFIKRARNLTCSRLLPLPRSEQFNECRCAGTTHPVVQVGLKPCLTIIVTKFLDVATSIVSFILSSTSMPVTKFSCSSNGHLKRDLHLSDPSLVASFDLFVAERSLGLANERTPMYVRAQEHLTRFQHDLRTQFTKILQPSFCNDSIPPPITIQGRGRA